MLEFPSYQNYPNDWKNDVDTLDWDMEMMGAYHVLIDEIWLNNGEFPLDFSKLSVIFRKKTQKTTKRIWKKIERKFFIVENGGPMIRNKRIDMNRQDLLANRLRSSNGGKKGMESRWKKDKPLIKPDKYTITSSITPTVTTTNTREKENIFAPSDPKVYHPESMEIIRSWLTAIKGDITTARQIDLDRIDEYVRNPKYGPELVRKTLVENRPVRPGSILAKLDFAASDQFHDESKKIDDIDYAAEYEKKKAANG